MNRKSRIWASIFVLIGLLFLIIGTVLMFVEHDLLNSGKYILISFVCVYAVVNMLQKRINADHFAWEVFLGINLAIIGLYPDTGDLFTNIMYFTGIVLFIIGLVRSQKLKSDTSI